ncbi:DoxX family protein [Afifella sp. IM 167]|uniref:DoxX family protein n=1 Tax=Afifella sp. IM 167 TaxID=2033586 RepID=UPI001CC916F6|nr:DoxX family protein [Afifella sp. IM 167]MBZ8133494.1 DoxX family protein [Afifella sp. IM 167]
MAQFNALFALVGRVLLAFMFVLAGFSKIGGFAGTQQYMESVGVPGALLPLVILVELGGGLLVALGLFSRWAALALAGFCVAAAFLFHFSPDDQMAMISFQKNLAIAGGFLMLTAFGPGAWSFDGAWRRG